MFFSIVKIAILCLVIISFLSLLYKVFNRQKNPFVQDKLDSAKDLYHEAKNELSEAGKMLDTIKTDAKKNLEDAAILEKKAEKIKQTIY